MASIQRREGRRRRVVSEINVVPYIDVMLVLLVIFMVAAPMVNPGVLNLPTVGGASAPKAPPVIVTIAADGALAMRVRDGNTSSEQKLGLKELTELLRERQQVNADEPVVIAADKTVRYEAVMDVMARLKAQGIRRVGLMVKSS